MSEVVVIGSGGHSRSVVALLSNVNIAVKGVYDPSFQHENKEFILDVPLVGNIEDVPIDSKVVLAVGDNLKRADLFSRFVDNLFHPSVVHDTCSVDGTSNIGKANLFFPKAFVNAAVEIGDNNILNSGCIIEHEVTIGNHCHISIGTIVGGRVSIGNSCFIGAGAVLKDSVNICSDVIVGAGGVVVKDIIESGVYVGNPVRKIK